VRCLDLGVGGGVVWREKGDDLGSMGGLCRSGFCC
jgi:hypothetical protein